MELLHTFYDILEHTAPTEGEGDAVYRIVLHPDSPIYRAHFPGRPITPGACIIQIVQELSQRHFADSSLQVRHLGAVKFLALLEPQHHPTVEVVLSGNPDHLQATVRDGSLLFARLTLALFTITNYRIKE